MGGLKLRSTRSTTSCASVLAHRPRQATTRTRSRLKSAAVSTGSRLSKRPPTKSCTKRRIKSSRRTFRTTTRTRRSCRLLGLHLAARADSVHRLVDLTSTKACGSKKRRRFVCIFFFLLPSSSSSIPPQSFDATTLPLPLPPLLPPLNLASALYATLTYRHPHAPHTAHRTPHTTCHYHTHKTSACIQHPALLTLLCT